MQNAPQELTINVPLTFQNAVSELTQLTGLNDQEIYRFLPFLLEAEGGMAGGINFYKMDNGGYSFGAYLRYSNLLGEKHIHYPKFFGGRITKTPSDTFSFEYWKENEKGEKIEPNVRNIVRSDTRAAAHDVLRNLSTKIVIRLQRLKQRREAREIDEHDFDLFNWLNYFGEQPLSQQDLGKQAVVLFPEEFQDISTLTIRLSNGEITILDSDDFPEDDILIIYPEDLG